MPFDNARFALLAVLCGLAAQFFSPFAGPGVRAGVVYRQPKVAQFARPDIRNVADSDPASLHHDQASFSFPWSWRGDPSKHSDQVRHSQKSTIAISNPHGAKYAVNHRRQAQTPTWVSTPHNHTLANATASTSSFSEPMSGTVAIVSRNSDSSKDRVLASLFLVKSDGTYVFDASDTNATDLLLTPAPSSETAASSSDTFPVKITVSIEGTPKPYCATYDQAPRNAEPLTAQQCTGDNVRSGHTSQTFIYNSTSGRLQPTYIQGQSVDAEDVGVPSASPSSPSPSASMGAANAGVVASSDSAYPYPSASASSVSWNRRDDNSTYAAQNVTLVFVPNRKPANAAAAAVQEVSTSTVTSTQTVIVFSSAASLSASAVNAADSTPSPFVSSSRSAAMAGASGLSVEVVGNVLPQAPLALSSVGMVAASRRPVPSPAPSKSSSPSIDAAASSVSTTPSPSVAGIDAVATPSDNSAAPMSSTPVSSSVKPLFERAVATITPASTEPYFWRFKSRGEVI